MTWLDDTVTTIALCWRIERRDGVTIGLTAHDRDLIVDGLVHRAAPGMLPSAIQRSTGLAADTMEVAGALTSEAFAAADLLAGRWDGAAVRMFAVDWSGGEGRVELGAGTIGAIGLSADGFTAELLGPGAELDRAAVETTSPDCRAAFGDPRCRVRVRRRFVRVVACDGAAVTVDAVVGDGFGNGLVRWFGGANAGLESVVAVSADAVLTLVAPPRLAVTAGTLIELVEGCDHRFATCRDRFGNAANFRGEPHLPGIDLVTRWPGE